MSAVDKENRIDHIEIPCTELETSRLFFEKVFRWEFISYGNDYILSENGGLQMVLYRSERSFTYERGAPLMVIYRDNLKKAEHDIVEFGGSITQPLFSFPGGSRFHFTDPSGNEFAVWSEKSE